MGNHKRVKHLREQEDKKKSTHFRSNVGIGWCRRRNPRLFRLRQLNQCFLRCVTIMLLNRCRTRHSMKAVQCEVTWTWGKLACAAGGGGGARKGAPVTGQSQEASLKPLMMTHQLRRKAAWKIFFKNHLEERLLDQALARASYTPFFCGHSRRKKLR